MEILFILENSWFNYIGNQRKSSKNETAYCCVIENELLTESVKNGLYSEYVSFKIYQTDVHSIEHLDNCILKGKDVTWSAGQACLKIP